LLLTAIAEKKPVAARMIPKLDNDLRAADVRRALGISSYISFLCECGEPGCRSRVWLLPEEYETIRSAAGRILSPGHVANAA
jgi:hypothetical protein